MELGKAAHFRDGVVPLIGKREVHLKMAADPAHRIVFEDKFPRANWGHPGVVRVLSASGEVLEEVIVNSPPKAFFRAKADAGIPLPIPTKAQVRLTSDRRWFVTDPSKHYALLLNGNASQRHWNDFAFLYRVLIEVYGYDRSRIFVADSFHKETLNDFDGDGKPDIEFDSTLTGIKGLFTRLKETLPRDSDLLVVVNDHGETRDGESFLVVEDGEIRASEFSQWLKEIPSQRAISLFQQCFGGGFVRPAVGDYRVALAASTNQEFSFATADLNFDEFLYHLTTALAGQTHEGKAISADANRDGRISIQEAFAYATAHDTTTESPLLESFPNSGFAALLGLFRSLSFTPSG